LLGEAVWQVVKPFRLARVEEVGPSGRKFWWDAGCQAGHVGCRESGGDISVHP